MKRLIGDILSLFFGVGDENYEPTREHYHFFWGVVIILIVGVWALNQS